MIEGFSVPTAISLFSFGLGVTLSVCIVLGGLAYFLRFSGEQSISIVGLTMYALPLMTLGIVIGYLASISREPTLSGTLPAVLTLAGGITVYIYSLESVRKSMIAGVSLLVFLLNLVCGSAYGSYTRETGKLERILYAIEQEKQIANYRKSRNLPEIIPDWVLK